MGIFSGIKNTFKKSEAAVVIQNLLEIQQKAGIFREDPAKIATYLVGNVWDQKPDIFEGKFGHRPHKLAVAAAALGNGFFVLADNRSMRSACFIALAEILKAVGTNGSLFQFNNVDHVLLDSSLEMFNNEAEQDDSKSAQFLG